jgi:hypothetical protein
MSVVVAGCLAGLGVTTARARALPAPSAAELTGDCAGTAYLPGARTTGNAANLVGCTYEQDRAWDDMMWQDLGWTDNCTPGAVGAIERTVGGSRTWTTAFTIGADGGRPELTTTKPWAGLDLAPGLRSSRSTTISRSSRLRVAAGRKAAVAAGQAMHHSRGRIRVDYAGAHLGGRDTWYITDVRIDIPVPGRAERGRQSLGREEKPCAGGDSLLVHERTPPYGFTPWPPGS